MMTEPLSPELLAVLKQTITEAVVAALKTHFGSVPRDPLLDPWSGDEIRMDFHSGMSVTSVLDVRNSKIRFGVCEYTLPEWRSLHTRGTMTVVRMAG